MLSQLSVIAITAAALTWGGLVEDTHDTHMMDNKPLEARVESVIACGEGGGEVAYTGETDARILWEREAEQAVGGELIAQACVPAAQDDSACDQATTASEPISSEPAIQPGASVGDRVVCPVMGDTFTITEDSPNTDHNGQTVYFCCSGCVQPFEDNPEDYLSEN